MIASKMKLRWWFIWYLCTWCGSYDGFIFFVWVNFFHLWRDWLIGKNFQFRTFFLYHKLCELKQFMKKRSDESKSNNGQQWIKSIFHPRTTMDQQKRQKRENEMVFCVNLILSHFDAFCARLIWAVWVNYFHAVLWVSKTMQKLHTKWRTTLNRSLRNSNAINSSHLMVNFAPKKTKLNFDPINRYLLNASTETYNNEWPMFAI